MRSLSPNINALNALVLWGILSPKQLSMLLGVSVSYCSKELQKLVTLGLAEDLGRSRLPPADCLYGRYYLAKRSGKIARWTKAKCRFKLRAIKGVGEGKIVRFTGGKSVRRHYLFATSSAFWVADFLGRRDPSNSAACFPETYLRTQLGWHRGGAPSRISRNPKLTMVPDALVIYRSLEIRIEGETTPKAAAAYRDAFSHLRQHDDTVIYVYPDSDIMAKVSQRLPEGYRIGEVVFGDEKGLEAVVMRHVLSLFGQ